MNAPGTLDSQAPAAAVDPVGVPFAHESAHLHVSGRATYVDDLPEPGGLLHAAVALSEHAHARILRLDLDAVRSAPGVRVVLCAADLAHRKFGPVMADEDLLADAEIQFHGQPLFALAADTRAQARAALRLARIEVEPLEAVIDLEVARERGMHLLPPVQIGRGDVEQVLAAAPHRLQGRVVQGGQEHFYLEGQISLAEPREDGSLHLWCSTQHPTEMQHLVAHALGVDSHRVSVECRRMGGAFGGKESQSAQWAIIAAQLAVASGHAVKLRLDRDEDMRATGKRHDFISRWDAGFDDRGCILGFKVELASRCGHSADLSGPVNDRALCHVDNAYFLDTVQIRSLRLRTHTVSNTAFRGFGGPQGMLVIETAIEDIALALGLDPLEVRRRNFYAAQPGSGRDLTPYGQTVEDNIIGELFDRLEETSGYRRRRAAIEAHNAAQPQIRRGIAMTPVKFGISFNATLYNQAGALVHVYTDGSVLVSHGGTEMGQGLYTKIRQVAAHEFGIPVGRVRLSATDTTRVPNTSATAASSGTDLNGKAVQDACRKIAARLAQLFAGGSGADAAAVRFEGGRLVLPDGRAEAFSAVVLRAYRSRIQLWDSGYYATPKIHYDPVTKSGRPFYYFAYGAACSEVAVDLATGETRVLRVDILHDAGNSLNPAIDIGQVEGGFVQGMGWLTSEELWWRADGRLMTHAPSTYKIPTATDVPARFQVELHQGRNVEDSIHRSKAVGEPPFMLAFSVLFAIRAALAGAVPAGTRVELDAPATPEAVLRALGVLEPA